MERKNFQLLPYVFDDIIWFQPEISLHKELPKFVVKKGGILVQKSVWDKKGRQENTKKTIDMKMIKKLLERKSLFYSNQMKWF